MKFFNRFIKRKNTLLLFILIFTFFGVFSLGHESHASVTYKPQVSGFTETEVTFGGTTKPLGDYIKGVYDYGISIVAILATVVMMIGGFQWIIAGGSAEKIGEAKAWIAASLTGLVLVLSSYMILNLINPNLTTFVVSNIEPIVAIAKPGLACCHSNGSAANVHKTCSISDPEDCTTVCMDGDIDCDDYCKDKNVAASCNSDDYCYEGRCLRGKGKINERCGIFTNTVCTDYCISSIANFLTGSDIYSGRNCENGLWCCAK